MAGCGGFGDELPRIGIAGTVTKGGNSVPSGSLAFVPVGKGPACGASVHDGEFSIDQSKGPVPGEYEVRLTTQTGKNFGKPDEPPSEPPKPIRIKISGDDNELELKF